MTPTFSDEEIKDSLRSGIGIYRTILNCKASYVRVSRIKKALIANGELIKDQRYTRNGWFVGRKPLDKIENTSRSTKDQWIKYMNKNPFYFQDIFNLPYSEEAVKAIANDEFKEQVCSCCSCILPKIKCYLTGDRIR